MRAVELIKCGLLAILVDSGQSTTCTGKSSALDPTQCSAFVDLYDSAGGAGWTYCESRTDPCSCTTSGRRITCANNSIIELILGGANMKGTIPKSINALTDLQQLWINDNKITSVAEIGGGFSQLKNLEVSWNNISHALPQGWSMLTKLTSLDIFFNSFTGQIPANIGALTDLATLTLSDNLLSGDVPISLGQLTQLETLDLENNQFGDDACTAVKRLLVKDRGITIKC